MTGTARILVFANEKGGTGKSTTAVHVAIALAAAGRRVAAIDLDTRQRTFARYIENRAAYANRHGRDLPAPSCTVPAERSEAALETEMANLGETHEFLIVDTPGRDDPVTRFAITRADMLVTPINDSFVDLDLIGRVDPESLRVTRPGFYAELVWELRQQRARGTGRALDWVVLRNRLQQRAARNRLRVEQAMIELSRRTGFRIAPGLGERVIFRELFPQGLTLLDLGAIPNAGLAHVAARQELRMLMAGLGLLADT